MKLLDATADHPLWNELWKLYETSFPAYELRDIESHTSAAQDKNFFPKMAVDESGSLLALLFYWKSDGLVFIEHIAVNATMRGRNIGSVLLGTFLVEHSDATVILEIDPPADEISCKRRRFYEKLGFIYNDVEYMHPSFRRNGHAHYLKLMSYPSALTTEGYDDFLRFCREKPYRYVSDK